MSKAKNIEPYVLAIHGMLSLSLGLALFYLRATMTNRVFEAIAVAIAVLLAAATLMMAAIADWFAAWSEGLRYLHRFTFYLFAGLALGIAGVLLGVSFRIYMPRLVFFASFHALAFGLLGVVVAWRATNHGIEQRIMAVSGSISIVFAIVMTTLSNRLDNRDATALLAAYLCFVAVKLFCIAWALFRKTERPDENLVGRQRSHTLSTVSSSRTS